MKRGQSGQVVLHEDMRKLVDALNELVPSQFSNPSHYVKVAELVRKWEDKLPEFKRSPEGYFADA